MIEDDETREETSTIGYYAMFEYQNGFRKTLYWSKKKMLAHANKYSQAFNLEAYKNLQDGKIPQSDLWKYSSFWYKDFDGMAYKTMLRQLISKWGIMSIEMQEAYTKDMATIKENGEYEYVDNVESSYDESTPILNNEQNTIEVSTKENEESKTTKRTIEKNKEVKEEQTTTEISQEENNITDNTEDDFFDD